MKIQLGASYLPQRLENDDEGIKLSEAMSQEAHPMERFRAGRGKCTPFSGLFDD